MLCSSKSVPKVVVQMNVNHISTLKSGLKKVMNHKKIVESCFWFRHFGIFASMSSIFRQFFMSDIYVLVKGQQENRSWPLISKTNLKQTLTMRKRKKTKTKKSLITFKGGLKPRRPA